MAEQRPATFNKQFGHDAALWLKRWRPDASADFVLLEKALDIELAEIGQGAAKRVMVPVPPRELRKPPGDGFGKPRLDRPGRVACNDRVGRDVLGHDGAGRDHRAGADRAAGQDDRAVADPDVMADMDMMFAAPCKEFGIVAFARKIAAGAVGKMRLRGPVHRVIARIDPRHRRDRTEFPNRGVGDLRVVHDVGIVRHRDLEQHGSGADLGIGAELAIAHRCGGIDRRFSGKHLAGHLSIHQPSEAGVGARLRCGSSSMRLMTMS